MRGVRRVMGRVRVSGPTGSFWRDRLRGKTRGLGGEGGERGRQRRDRGGLWLVLGLATRPVLFGEIARGG